MTAAEFRLRFPAFADPAAYPDALIETYMGIAARRMDAPTWGRWYEDGLGFLTAHLLTLRDRDAKAASAGNAGAPVQTVAAEQAGQVRVQYAASPAGQSAGEALLSSTSYGQAYISYYPLIARPLVT